MRKFAEQIAAKEQKLRSLYDEIEHKQAQRENKEKIVPEEWREKYASMLLRVENPVVTVENGNCTGCFSLVNQQDLAALARHKILPCKTCYRLLYLI